jgi:maltose O-acetyltransferase
MKKIIQVFASFSLTRLFTLIFLKFRGFIERIISNLKYRALVKDCADSICHYTTEIKYGDRIKVGKGSRIGKNCTLGAKGGISIGENVVLSKYVTIETAGLDLSQGPPYNKHFGKPIIIEDGVWIGTNSIILNGVTIGENSVIGACTVVTKDVNPSSIIVGSSNRKLK